MKEKSGITLITLVITIILLLILAGVSISVGTESINNAKKTRFDAELRVIHTRVNELLEEMSISEIGQMLTANNYDYSIPNDKNSKAITAVGSSNIENYWYFNKTGLEKLGVLSINREVLINFSTREVVDLEGIDHNGEKIYRLLDWENIAHVDKTAGSVPTFSLSKKVYGLNATIIVNNLSYGESVSRGTISYCLLNQDGTDGEWKQASGTEIPVSVSGTYKVRVTNTAETPTSTMHTINITLTNQPKLDSGMVPVVYVEANPEGYWEIADENGGEWYDYSSDNDKWANVMLLDGLTVEGNITVTNANKIDLIGRRVTTPGSIRTWLPRCMYKHGNNSEEITDIKFLKGSTNIATDNTNEPVVNTGAENTWSIHGAFSNENVSLSGIWAPRISQENQQLGKTLTILNSMINTNVVISFNANGGQGGQSSNVTATYGEAMPAISTTAPTREGYTFAGYYDDTSGGTQYYTAEGTSARTWDKSMDTTLYAGWIDGTPPQVTIASFTNSTDYLFAIRAQITITDDNSGVDYNKCKYALTATSTPLGTNLESYNTGSISSENATIEKAISAGTYYLHVLATDNEDNRREAISSNPITIASTANYSYAQDTNGNGIEQRASLLPGSYKLECWGAQGGNTTENTTTYHGGYGAYAVGKLDINETKNLYINVGEMGGNTYAVGSSVNIISGGYNGGAGVDMSYSSSTEATQYFGAGGGATHIAYSTGVLSDFSTKQNDILIVAAGGGGSICFRVGSNSNYVLSHGGSGGGYIGTIYEKVASTLEEYLEVELPTQTTPGRAIYNGTINSVSSFGIGGTQIAGGGGGLYGGIGSTHGGGGGVSYLGLMLTNIGSTLKHMTGYGVTEHIVVGREYENTYNTSSVNEVATADVAKIGNGYARITNMN